MENRFLIRAGIRVSAREHRLCWELGSTAEGNKKNFSEDLNKQVNADQQKKNVELQTQSKLENQKKLAELRAEVKKFEDELRTGNALQQEAKKKGNEGDAKMKQALDQQREKEQKALGNLIGVLAAADPPLVKTLFQDANLPGINVANENFQKTLGSQLQALYDMPESRDTLLKGLTSLQQGIVPSFLSGNQGILKFAQDMLASKNGQEIYKKMEEAGRKFGVTVTPEMVVQLSFGVLRGFFANLLATSPLLDVFPGMAERALLMYYRIDLEAALKSKIQSDGLPQVTFVTLISMPLAQIEEQVLGNTPAYRESVRNTYNKLFMEWRARKLKAQADSAFRSAVGPRPTIATAIAEMTKSAKEKTDKDNQMKDKIEKDRKPVQDAVTTYMERPSVERLVNLELGDTDATGTVITATPAEEQTSEQIIKAANRPVGSHTTVAGGGVRFTGITGTNVGAFIKGLVH